MAELQKETALRALQQYRGDDHLRAARAFQGMTEMAMVQEHGQSGKTRREILDGYNEHVRKVDEAIAWLKEIPA